MKKTDVLDSLIEEDEPEPIKEREVNMKYLHLYCLALGLCNMQNGWAIAGSNQSQLTIAAQLGWTKEERINNYSLINVATMVGLALGSVAGGMMIGSGRRRTIFIMNFILILSTVATCCLNFWAICIGKFVFGFAATGV